jgi:hypothetical protein
VSPTPFLVKRGTTAFLVFRAPTVELKECSPNNNNTNSMLSTVRGLNQKQQPNQRLPLLSPQWLGPARKQTPSLQRANGFTNS